MNFRGVILLAVLSLVAVNTALVVLGNVKPGCTQYRYLGEPILCAPDQPTQNCSANTASHTTVKRWLIQTKNDGEHRASSPNQTHPKYPGAPPNFVWHSAQEDVVVTTGAVCGGRYMHRFPGPFGSEQTTDPESYVIQQLDALSECSDEYNCFWDDYLITGFWEGEINPLAGDPYIAFFKYTNIVGWCDTVLVSGSTAMRIIWRDAYDKHECLDGM